LSVLVLHWRLRAIDETTRKVAEHIVSRMSDLIRITAKIQERSASAASKRKVTRDR
jgi:hypothetical protein